MNSNELLDQNFIHPQNLETNKYVVFNLPKIYVSVDLKNEDKSYHNIRAIDYEKLMYFMNKYGDILSMPIEKCQLLIREVFEDLQKSKNFNKTEDSTDGESFIFKVLELISESYTKGFKFEQNFVPTNMNTRVSFDVIREYTNDNQQIFIDAIEKPWYCTRLQQNVMFYSQLNNDEIIEARTANNDTELNRVQYLLKVYEYVMMFRPKFILDYMIRYLTIIAFKICLCSHSLNVEGLSDNDLIPHYLCLMLDIIIRTRLTTAWQRDPQCAALLKDMAYNYESNFMSNSMLIENDIDRVKVVLIDLKENYPDPVIQDMLKNININDYVAVLNSSIGIIDNVAYYMFNTQIFEKILLSGTMNKIKDSYNRPELKEKIKNVMNTINE